MVLVPDVHLEYTADIICQILHYSFQQYHDENCRTYVSITGYFLKDINVHWWSINSQHYMLAHPDSIQQQHYQNQWNLC